MTETKELDPHQTVAGMLLGWTLQVGMTAAWSQRVR